MKKILIGILFVSFGSIGAKENFVVESSPVRHFLSDLYSQQRKAWRCKDEYSNTKLKNIFSKSLSYVTPENVNDSDSKGRTLLYWAVSIKDYRAVNFLLRSGADLIELEHRSFDNCPVFHAITYDDYKALKILLSFGVDPNNAYDQRYWGSCLYYAYFHSSINCIKVLVKDGRIHPLSKDPRAVSRKKMVTALGKHVSEMDKILSNYEYTYRQPSNSWSRLRKYFNFF